MKNKKFLEKKKIALIIILVLVAILSGLLLTKNILDKQESLKIEEKEPENKKDNKTSDSKEDNVQNEDDKQVTIEDKSLEDEKNNVSSSSETKTNNTSTNDKNVSKSNEETSNKNTVEENNIKENPTKEEKKPEEIKVISTKNVEEDDIETKYGVKITTKTTYKVDTYSDGSIKKTKINTSTFYDKGNYSATTSELKSEATSIASKNKSIYQEVVKYVNGYRSEVGVNSLVLDNDLSIAATIRALEMAYSGDIMDISHTRPNGSSCDTVLKEFGITSYNAWGENIAAGYVSALDVSQGWRNSEGHYQNMITDYFGKIGIGMVEVNGAKFWVQLFTN